VNDWLKICSLDEIPRLGARVVKTAGCDIAVFRDAGDAVFALDDRCPHQGGPLSQGIVTAGRVTCPLHGWNIALASGEACDPDSGCTRSHEVKISDGAVFLPGYIAEPSVESA